MKPANKLTNEIRKSVGLKPLRVLPIGINVEPIKITVDDKVILVFSHPEELASDMIAYERLRESVSEIKEVLNEWAKSSDDQFFALITDDSILIKFQKVSDE